MARVGGIVRGVYHSLFRPEVLIQAQSAHKEGTLLFKLRELRELLTVYVINLALYAGPLTAAGFGRENVPPAPSGIREILNGQSALPLWEYAYGFLQNSLYILGATVLTLITFHLSILLIRKSKGFLRSAYAIVYSTSIYLAGIFTLVWYLSTNEGVVAASRLVIEVQKAFIYSVIDIFGANLKLPGGRPGNIVLESISLEGQLLLSLLVVLVFYFLSSLYLAARVNHEVARFDGILAVAAVALSPVVYVAVSVVVFITQRGLIL